MDKRTKWNGKTGSLWSPSVDKAVIIEGSTLSLFQSPKALPLNEIALVFSLHTWVLEVPEEPEDGKQKPAGTVCSESAQYISIKYRREEANPVMVWQALKFNRFQVSNLTSFLCTENDDLLERENQT